MNSNKIVFIVLVFIILTITVLSVTKLKNNASSNSFSIYNDLYNSKLTNFFNLELDQIMSNGNSIDDSVFITDLANKNTSLKSILENENTLMCRITERNCNTCVDSIISILKSKNANVTFLVSYSNYNMIKNLKHCSQIESPIYIISLNILKLKVEEVNLPYLFTISRNGEIQNAFIPLKEYPERTRSYLSYVINKV